MRVVWSIQFGYDSLWTEWVHVKQCDGSVKCFPQSACQIVTQVVQPIERMWPHGLLLQFAIDELPIVIVVVTIRDNN